MGCAERGKARKRGRRRGLVDISGGPCVRFHARPHVASEKPRAGLQRSHSARNPKLESSHSARSHGRAAGRLCFPSISRTPVPPVPVLFCLVCMYIHTRRQHFRSNQLWLSTPRSDQFQFLLALQLALEREVLCCRYPDCPVTPDLISPQPKKKKKPLRPAASDFVSSIRLAVVWLSLSLPGRGGRRYVTFRVGDCAISHCTAEVASDADRSA